MKAYDIVLDQNNELVVILYKVNVVRENGQSFYQIDFFKRIPVFELNIAAIVKDLMENDYFSLSKLEPTSFLLDEGNFPYLFRSLTLSYKHKLLEKVYEETVIDGLSYLNIYVTYVNVVTGELFVLKANSLENYSNDLEVHLEESGFKHISSSFLAKYINNINNIKSSPIVLNRVK